LSDYSQKRQSRIRDLIKETLEETKKQQENTEQPSIDISQDQSQVVATEEEEEEVIECID
jgi:hypothetical protein